MKLLFVVLLAALSIQTEGAVAGERKQVLDLETVRPYHKQWVQECNLGFKLVVTYEYQLLRLRGHASSDGGPVYNMVLFKTSHCVPVPLDEQAVEPEQAVGPVFVPSE